MSVLGDCGCVRFGELVHLHVGVSETRRGKKGREAFRPDREFQEAAKSEQGEKTPEKADLFWLRPIDFSAMK